MKKEIIYILIAIAMLGACSANKQSKRNQSSSTEISDMAHNSQNSLDWEGVYKGTIPCADCAGIEVELRISYDMTYDRVMTYIGKDDNRFSDKGKIEWDDTGGKIRLINSESPDEANSWFRVGEHRLIMLDIEGNPIKSNISPDFYILNKIDSDWVITEKYWKLIELNGKNIPRTEESRREAHLILKEKDNKISGNTGCNVMNGTYSLSDNNGIKFSPIATTRMACVNVDYEQEYLNVFADCDGYSIQNDTLTLSKESVTLAKFAAIYLR